MKDRVRNLFKIHRFDYQIWSDEKLLADGQGTRGKVFAEIEYHLMELALGSPVGDGFTVMIAKAK